MQIAFIGEITIRKHVTHRTETADRRFRAALLLLLLAPHAAVMAHAAHPEGLRWSGDPLVLSLLILSGVLYLVGTRKLWRASRPGGGIRKWEAACYRAGWLALVAALASPIDPLGEVLFSVHMVQHELLMQLAAPLLVLGRPLAVFAWALPASWRSSAGSVVKAAPLRAIWRLITYPLAAWVIHALALWIWHAPDMFEAGLADPAVHTLEHFSFLFSALLFWWALFHGRQSHGGLGMGIVYLLTTAMHTGVLGALLIFSSQAWYPAYARTTAAWDLTPLEDQQLGGLIMWVPGGLVYLVAALWVVSRLLRGGSPKPVQADLHCLL